MDPLIAGLVGIVVGGWLTSVWSHRQWLRERRHDEYANVLTSYPRASSASAAAAQALMLYPNFDTDPEQRALLRERVVEAWGAGEAFLAAHDRLQLVATSDALRKADALGAHLLALPKLKPMAFEADAGTVEVADFPKINRDATDRASDFVSAHPAPGRGATRAGHRAPMAARDRTDRPGPLTSGITTGPGPDRGLRPFPS